MLDREWHESQENWQATYRVGNTEKFHCVMRSIFPGSYYWSIPDYDGLFAYGATRNFTFALFDYDMEYGLLELVAGAHPEKLEPVYRGRCEGYTDAGWFRTGVVSEPVNDEEEVTA